MTLHKSCDHLRTGSITIKSWPLGFLGRLVLFLVPLVMTNILGAASAPLKQGPLCNEIKPKIISFTAAQNPVTVGTGTALTAVFTGGLGTIDHGIGPVTSGVPKGTGNLKIKSTFTLTVRSARGAVATKSITIDVVASPSIVSFTAAKNPITAGTGTSLTSVFKGGTGSVDQGVGGVTSGVAKTTGNLTATTTYSLTVTNSAGTSVTKKLTLNVVPVPIIIGFLATPSIVTVGHGSTLSWSVSGATSLTLDQGVGDVTGSTTKPVNPGGTTTYTLQATNSAGTSSMAQTTVSVVPAPSITSFSATPSVIAAGQSSNLMAMFSGVGTVDHWIGNLSSGMDVSTGPLTSTTTYTLTVASEAGDVVPLTASITVAVESGPTSGSFMAAGFLNVTRTQHTATLLPSGKVLMTGGGSDSGSATSSSEIYDPATSSYSLTAPMIFPRADHAATLMDDGRVLITGGGVASAEIYDSVSGQFTLTGSSQNRYGHIAAKLLDGRVLIAGGQYSATAEIYDPSTGIFTPTGSMRFTRSGATATLLPASGKVLIVGGDGTDGFYDAKQSAELYDASTGTFTVLAAMNASRFGHTATLLPDGEVLIAGGYSAGASTSAEIFDPKTQQFKTTGSMSVTRAMHTATLLPNGKVLFVGGAIYSQPFPEAEVYDPIQGVFSGVGSMLVGKYMHTATLLSNGQVLIAGGTSNDSYATMESEVFVQHESGPGTFTPTASMQIPRFQHTATVLSLGKVLITGGSGNSAVAEIYDIGSGTFAMTSPMAYVRSGHSATLLKNGKVLIFGGSGDPNSSGSVEIYDPVSGVFSSPGFAHLNTPRQDHTATLLPNGTVLVAGGVWGGEMFPVTAEIYDPSSSTFSATLNPMIQPRSYHTATNLPDGRVLFTGGEANGVQLNSAEIYDPANGTFTFTGSMQTPRSQHTATLLGNNKVLVTGGKDSTSFNTAELYDVNTGIFESISSMPIGGYGHTATLLPNGKVLLSGCFDPTGWVMGNAVIYDVATGQFQLTGSMNTLRHLHSAVLLPNDRVLISGGVDGFSMSQALDTAELYF